MAGGGLTKRDDRDHPRGAGHRRWGRCVCVGVKAWSRVRGGVFPALVLGPYARLADTFHRARLAAPVAGPSGKWGGGYMINIGKIKNQKKERKMGEKEDPAAGGRSPGPRGDRRRGRPVARRRRGSTPRCRRWDPSGADSGGRGGRVRVRSRSAGWRPVVWKPPPATR